MNTRLEKDDGFPTELHAPKRLPTLYQASFLSTAHDTHPTRTKRNLI